MVVYPAFNKNDSIQMRDNQRALQTSISKVARLNWSENPICIDEMLDKAAKWSKNTNFVLEVRGRQ